MASLKVNEIRSVIKMGILIKRHCFERVAEEVWAETFLQWIKEAESFYKNFNEITIGNKLEYISLSPSLIVLG